MPKISVIAKLTAVEGKEAELEAALLGLIDAADEEPGLEIYSAHRSNDEPGVYWFFELYTDAAASSVHNKGDGMRAANRAFAGLLAGRPEVIRMAPVAAKGLEL